MKTLSICSQITYVYEVEVPDDYYFVDDEELLNYTDEQDPVYRELCGVLSEANLDYTGSTISIVDADTYEDLYHE